MTPISKLFLTLFVVLNFNAFAQTALNQYKYFSVPERFEFLKESDQYQVNSLTKFLLQKNGLIVLQSDDDYPEDLASNRCLMAQVEVVKLKGFLKTKLQVQFKNCRNEVIYTSDIGMSREKEYIKAYHQALRGAFKSISDLGYKFSSPLNTPNSSKTFNSSIQRPDPSEIVSSPRSQPDPIPSAVVDKIPPPPPPVKSSTELDKLQDRPPFIVRSTPFGFDVISTATKEIVFSLHQTMYEGLYIIENHPGIVYKRGNRWVREYISENKTIIEPLF